MVRADKSGVKDVGPRSAHIAGMDYAVFTPEEEIVDPKVIFFSPKEGDPDDYVAIELASGKRITITNTCAANVLGLISPDNFAYGNANAARKAMQPLADYMGKTVEEVATQILTRAYEKIEPVITELAAKYRLEKDQISLVGVGGGAAALIGFCSDKMGLRYSIPETPRSFPPSVLHWQWCATSLSALCPIPRRRTSAPSSGSHRQGRRERRNAGQRRCAYRNRPADLQADGHRPRLHRGQDDRPAEGMHPRGSRPAGRRRLKATTAEVKLEGATKNFFVYGLDRKNKHPLRILDKKGFIKVQRNDGKAVLCKAGSYRNIVSQLWEELAIY